MALDDTRTDPANHIFSAPVAGKVNPVPTEEEDPLNAGELSVAEKERRAISGYYTNTYAYSRNSNEADRSHSAIADKTQRGKGLTDAVSDTLEKITKSYKDFSIDDKTLDAAMADAVTKTKAKIDQIENDFDLGDTLQETIHRNHDNLLFTYTDENGMLRVARGDSSLLSDALESGKIRLEVGRGGQVNIVNNSEIGGLQLLTGTQQRLILNDTTTRGDIRALAQQPGSVTADDLTDAFRLRESLFASLDNHWATVNANATASAAAAPGATPEEGPAPLISEAALREVVTPLAQTAAGTYLSTYINPHIQSMPRTANAFAEDGTEVNRRPSMEVRNELYAEFEETAITAGTVSWDELSDEQKQYLEKGGVDEASYREMGLFDAENFETLVGYMDRFYPTGLSAQRLEADPGPVVASPSIVTPATPISAAGPDGQLSARTGSLRASFTPAAEGAAPEQPEQPQPFQRPAPALRADMASTLG